ncbi:hypothetical protein BN3590_00440 [Clostridium sp. C105KSO15]|nr:hypothetical protein BN3590_00440 [Clostridium sp. C105KSO15]
MFDGIWHLTDFVFTGQFDTILVKPISPLLQVLSQEIGLQGIGLVTLGIYILFSSLKQLELLNFFHIFFSCIFFITGVVFRLSIYIIGASSIFYLRNTPKDPLFAIYSLGDNAIYPLSIYPTWMRIILLLIFPFGFIGYIPIIFFKTQNMVLFIATIIFAFFFILLARYVYYKGIRRYESAGT